MNTAEGRKRWRRLREDGCEWEARVSARLADADLLEFVCLDGSRRPRQLAVERDAYGEMDEDQLRHAWLRSRPIGGDHYGRPGKHMNDAG